MRAKIVNREKRLKEAEKKHGKESPEASLAQERLQIAHKHYDATKEGIKKLKSELSNSEYDEELLHRYKEAKITNEVQSLSVKEIKTERQDEIAEIYSTLYDQHPDEAMSTLDSARTVQEQKVISNLNQDNSTDPISQEAWTSFVSNLRRSLKADNSYDETAAAKLDNLEQTSPPPKYVFACYAKYNELMNLVTQHKNRQYNHLASILGAEVKDVESIHNELKEAYRKSEVKPSVPEQWLRGESPNMGLANNPKMRYAPADKASAYATYAMLYNQEALPDYKKRARNFVTISQDSDHYSLNCYSTTGKLLYQKDYDKGPDTLSRIKQESEGSTILSERLSKTNLSLEEVVSNHLDIPKYDRKFVQASLKLDEKTNIVEMYLKTLSSSKKLWNSKPERKQLISRPSDLSNI